VIRGSFGFLGIIQDCTVEEQPIYISSPPLNLEGTCNQPAGLKRRQPSAAAVPRTFSDFLEGYLDTNPKVKYGSPLIRVETES
jgi:hypothetical protein